MFGISFPELMVVMVVALIVLGPKRLPEIARLAGRWSGELRKHSDSFRREFYNSVYTPANEIQERLKNEARSLTSIPTTPNPATTNTASTPQATAPNKVEPDSTNVAPILRDGQE